MAEFFDHITDKHAAFMAEQSMFFTASACAEGRINLSPKGIDSFRILSPNLCGYVDLTGSGNETSAHIKHDGRLTIMFNSFTRNALIYRLYGKGRVVREGQDDFAKYAAEFPQYAGARQIILLDVESTQTSCGWGVPEMTLTTDRGALTAWADKRSAEEVRAYQLDRNLKSIDGLETGIVE